MTVATDLASALAPILGTAEERIHTALPPIGLGGGADVLEFRRSKVPGGVVYLSAGASAHRRPEIVVCTREPAEWAVGLVSKLAAVSLTRPFAWCGSLPLADGPFAGLIFHGLLGLVPATIGGRWTSYLLALGVTKGELAASRSHGVPYVVELLKANGTFPFSDARRAELPAIATLGRSPLSHTGLSPDARDGLVAVVNGQSEDVEMRRARFPTSDLEILIRAYDDLGSLYQRAELIHLIQDSKDPCLLPLYRAYARDAARAAPFGPSTGEHASLAAALSAIDGSFDRFDHWYDDLDRALARAREIAAQV